MMHYNKEIGGNHVYPILPCFLEISPNSSPKPELRLGSSAILQGAYSLLSLNLRLRASNNRTISALVHSHAPICLQCEYRKYKPAYLEISLLFCLRVIISELPSWYMFIQLQHPHGIPTKERSSHIIIPQFDIFIRRLNTRFPAQLWEICPEHDLLPTDCICKLYQLLRDVAQIMNVSQRTLFEI